MIRSLRGRHRAMTLALALTVPLLFVAGLRARRPMPTPDLPAALSGPAFDPADALAVQLKNTGSGLALRLTTLSPAAGAVERRLVVELPAETARPELLVYWQAGRSDGASVGDGAFLLGAWSGGTTAIFPLPPAAATDRGSLLFFSLAQQEIVDTVELRLPAAPATPVDPGADDGPGAG